MTPPSRIELPPARRLASLEPGKSSARLARALRAGYFDFVDLGTHRGHGLELGRRLGGTRGLGIESDASKCIALLEKGQYVMRADVASLPDIDQAVDFAVCSHILEHLPDRQALHAVLIKLRRLCRKFIYIEQPNFSTEEPLRKLGLKLSHSTLDYHTCRVTTEELTELFRELGLEPFVLAETEPILDSQNHWVHRLDAPENRWHWNEATDPPRPYVRFDPPIYRDVVAVVATGGADLEAILARRGNDLHRLEVPRFHRRAPDASPRSPSRPSASAPRATTGPSSDSTVREGTGASVSDPSYPFTRAAHERRAFVAKHLPDWKKLRVLEIGAFDNPTFVRPESDVQHVDWQSKRQLVAKHRNNPRRRPELAVDVDHVLKGRPLSEVVPGSFNLVAANHIAVRMPDLVGWLLELARVTDPGGHALLTIPDRRYTFDVDRQETDVVELLRCHEEKLTQPSYYQILRDLYYHRSVQLADVLAGEDTPHPRPRRYSLSEAIDRASVLVKAPTSFHCHVFTCDSFRTVWMDLATAGLVPWIDVEIGETPRGRNEFPVLLRRTDVELG